MYNQRLPGALQQPVLVVLEHLHVEQPGRRRRGEAHRREQVRRCPRARTSRSGGSARPAISRAQRAASSRAGLCDAVTRKTCHVLPLAAYPTTTRRLDFGERGVIGTEPSLECVTPGMGRNPQAKKETKSKTSHARLTRPYHKPRKPHTPHKQRKATHSPRPLVRRYKTKLHTPPPKVRTPHSPLGGGALPRKIAI
eukprot:5828192-Prymnesium_polylepis.1